MTTAAVAPTWWRAADAGKPGDDDGLGRVRSSEWFLHAAGRWWVLHTRLRNEKRVAHELAERRVRHYLPLVTVRHTYAKSRARFDVPLFPGYVFLCGDDRDCDAARRTNRVATILPVFDQAGLRKELMHIYCVVERGQAVELFPAIQPGQRCRITGGVLKDVEGVVVRHGARCRMYLSVSTLGQSAAVEVDAALLEVID
jgi:transcriptional antiterminator RfaH